MIRSPSSDSLEPEGLGPESPAPRMSSRREGLKRGPGKSTPGSSLDRRERETTLKLCWQPLLVALLLVTLGERIRLDQVGGLVEQLVLTVRLGAADAGLRPEVMVLVDADIAFRRTLELDAWRRGRDLVDVEASGLLRRQLPQPRAEIGRLRHVADHGLLAPHLLERRHEGLVVGIVERLEVLHAGIGARDVLPADAVDLVFGHRDGEQRLLREIDASRLELLVEYDVRAADDDGVDDVGLGQFDLVDHRVELGAAKREVFLADHLAALQMALDVLAGDLVRRARPDVVGAEQVESLRA